MSEFVATDFTGGPVEIANSVQERVVQLSRQIVGFDPESYGSLVPAINELDSKYPYFGKRVYINGRTQTPLFDDEMSVAGYVFMETDSVTEGEHLGFDVAEETIVIDDHYLGVVPRLVHVIFTGAEVLLDADGTQSVRKRHSYIQVEGSTVLPQGFTDVHSLEALKDDPVSESIDVLLLNNDLEPQKALSRLQELFIIPQNADPETRYRWQQRVSYLNSLDAIESLVLLADIAYRNGEEYEVFPLISGTDNALTFTNPTHFELAPEWYCSRQGVWSTTGRLRLALAAQVDDGTEASCLLHLPFVAERSS